MGCETRIMKRFIATSASICSIFFLAGLVGIATSAYGFSVGRLKLGYLPNIPFGDENHEAITLDALDRIRVSVDGYQLSFQPSARATIKNANVEADSQFFDVSKYHFDSEEFFNGNQLLINLRQTIVWHAKRGEFPEAQELIGIALHAVQDFYSHTTWIEKGFAGTAPLGMSSSPLFVKSTGATCTLGPSQTIDNVSTGIILDSQLAGEYSDSTTVLGSDFWRNKDGKCIHGTGFLPNGVPRGAGINKDTDSRDFHQDARARATDASEEYVKLILSDLTGNGEAIRGLLDQPSWTKIYSDTFTRKNGPVGNRWVTSEYFPIEIRSGKVVALDTPYYLYGGGKIYRHVQFPESIAISADLTAGLTPPAYKRFAEIGIGFDDITNYDSSWGGVIMLFIPDVNGSGRSGVLLYQDGLLKASASPPFVFSNTINVRVTFSKNGTVTGRIRDGVKVFNFNMTLQSGFATNNIGFRITEPYGGYSATVDNVVLESK